MKTLKTIALAIAVLCFAASCTEENIQPKGGAEGNTMINPKQF